jgi:hypothetical protein
MSAKRTSTDQTNEPYDDLRILGYDPLIPPQILQQDYPLVGH